jgi:ArsR family transcriptional regulator
VDRGADFASIPWPREFDRRDLADENRQPGAITVNISRCDRFTRIVDMTPMPHQGPLSAAAAVEVAATLKALSDPVRLRLFSLIASNSDGEICVCDLAGKFDVTQPTISHHLKKLRVGGLVDQERRGTWIFYSVPPAVLIGLSSLLDVIPQPAVYAD